MLEPFARSLEASINELRLPRDWREQLGSYLDDWHARGFQVVDEYPTLTRRGT